LSFALNVTIRSPHRMLALLAVRTGIAQRQRLLLPLPLPLPLLLLARRYVYRDTAVFRMTVLPDFIPIPSTSTIAPVVLVSNQLRCVT